MFDLVPFGRRREDAWGPLAKAFNDVFNDDFFTSMRPQMLSFKTDVRETDQAYLLEAELPGFRKEDIDIDYAAPYLTIRAVHQEDGSVEDNHQQLVHKERRYVEYVRRFYVQDIDEDSIRASLKDGLLKLEVPKRQSTKSKRIKIQD
ncbi:Hsp20/alpha crystallin family protein [Paenibacillus apis]|uniref:Heat-shock protein Hsp20 n=1 Tax=Paenibacillus apis TaxID=1792174 RepID=A0A919Y8W5_9BACL|nr:Hsp20/alpha crystallin family protein [Paenibacillus apis]GIO44212.1 heat-shock protein Hsp20 [Paenibacillus apis]